MEQNGAGSPRRKIVRRTAEQIKLLITEYENSGLSANSFCNLHKIKKAYFSRWLKRYRSNKPPNGFVSVREPNEPSNPEAILFAEYRGIRFYQPIDPSYLKSLLS